MPQRAYKAIFFDLDGTLLPVDMDEFLQAYFKGMGAFAAKQGYDPKVFIDALGRGVKAMIVEEGGRNDQRFWRVFCELLHKPKEELEEMMAHYYADEFAKLGELIKPAPEAAQIITTLKAKGYPLYLTTMPVFPIEAVRQRVQWAGIDPDVFDHITVFDNSTSTKPHLKYYRENVARIGLAPEDILMVGNNTREDLAAMQLGLDGYLVTDWLLNPDGFDIETVKHGSLADLLKFAEALPACKAGAESGAASAESGAVASAETGASSETAAETGTAPHLACKE